MIVFLCDSEQKYVETRSRKKEQTTPLVVQAVLQGFRAIDSGACLRLRDFIRDSNNVVHLAAMPLHYRLA